MVGLVTAMRVLGGGLHNYGFTVFFLPLSQDLGLSRAATSLAFSLARAEGAIEGPFVGYFIDRFGPRPMLLLATIMCGRGYILLAWVDSYTAFLIVYLGIISLSFTPGFVHASMAVGNTWFIRYRARAMTVISSAVPIGGALLTPLLAMAVQAWGWRWGAVLAGTLFLLIGIPLGLGVRPSPESMGLLPDGDLPRLPAGPDDSVSDPSPKKSEQIDPTLREAMKTIIFWLFVDRHDGARRRLQHPQRAFHSDHGVERFEPRTRGLPARRFCLLNWAAHYVIGPIADAVNRPKLLGGLHARCRRFHAPADLARCALGALVIHDSFHRHRRLVSDGLGDHRRFLRAQIFRHHPRHHGFFLHVGRRDRPGCRGRYL